MKTGQSIIQEQLEVKPGKYTITHDNKTVTLYNHEVDDYIDKLQHGTNFTVTTFDGISRSFIACARIL